MNIKPYILVLLIALLPLASKAQVATTPLYTNLPSDSLMYMLYFNKAHFAEEKLVKKAIEELPEAFQGVASGVDEFCFHGQAHKLYDVYRIDFKSKAPVSIEELSKALEKFRLTVKDFKDGMVLLEGGSHQFGYFVKGKHYSTLKIYSQTTVIDDELRVPFEKVRGQLINSDNYKDYDESIHLRAQLDSIGSLDTLTAKNYFEGLIGAEQSDFSNGVDIQEYKSKLKVKSNIKVLCASKPVVAYVDNKQINRLPYYLYSDIDYGFYEMMGSLNAATAAFITAENGWYSADVTQKEIKIECISSLKKGKHFCYALDTDVMKYLPQVRPESFVAYNLNIAELKAHLLKHFSIPHMHGEEEGYAKLAMLAVDDDFLAMISNGFIAVNKGEAFGRDFPDFKVVFKLSDQRKGKMLMRIVCEDFDMFHDLGNNKYVIGDRVDSDEKINLCIKGDVWIMGTASFDELQKELSSATLKVKYPEVNGKKVLHYAKVNETLFGSSDGAFKTIEYKSQLINKKTISSTAVIKR